MNTIKDYMLNDIETEYTKLFLENKSIEEFEKWVYTTEELESVFSADDYLNLISLNYKNKNVLVEIEKILEKYIRKNIVKSQRLLYVLDMALKYDDNYCEYLGIIYEYYCDGYYFLRDIALVDGLECRAPGMFDYKYYENLSDTEKKTLRAKFNNGAVKKVRKVIKWLDRGQIILTDNDSPIFIDKRKRRNY